MPSCASVRNRVLLRDESLRFLRLMMLAGRDATLLIHEATLEDGLEQEAVEKRHR